MVERALDTAQQPVAQMPQHGCVLPLHGQCERLEEASSREVSVELVLVATDGDPSPTCRVGDVSEEHEHVRAGASERLKHDGEELESLRHLILARPFSAMSSLGKSAGSAALLRHEHMPKASQLPQNADTQTQWTGLHPHATIDRRNEFRICT